MCSNLVRAVNAQRWDDQCLKEFLLNLILGTFLRFSHSSTGRSTVFWGLDEADDKRWTCSITRKNCSDQFQVKIPQKLLELGEKNWCNHQKCKWCNPNVHGRGKNGRAIKTHYVGLWSHFCGRIFDSPFSRMVPFSSTWIALDFSSIFMSWIRANSCNTGQSNITTHHAKLAHRNFKRFSFEILTPSCDNFRGFLTK